jgi:hypothetical protein
LSLCSCTPWFTFQEAFIAIVLSFSVELTTLQGSWSTRTGETLHISLDCDGCRALVNLTIIGGVNETTSLSRGDTVRIHVERGGLTIAYARVESCEGGVS